LYKKKNKIIDVQLFTPVVCSEEFLNKIKQMLISTFDFKGINIENIVDNSMIGGYLIRFDDIQIDNSISSKIKNIRNKVQSMYY
jgi:F-type H+-transporting ATPase subunit delta